ncbi:hypothetical protein OHS18_20500 [Amycolatopsis sp. NBC_00355]|uniref:hypothetical protein n=1 Tax=Amycolatopsis sp. NBC_00355 TaxID=2975957 RepID=UPI002E2646B7
MPKPLITKQNGMLSRSRRTTNSAASTGGRLKSGRRSDNYLRAVRALDASGNLSAVEIDEFIDGVRREFAEKYHTIPTGIVAECHLGEPFEVHTLALDGSIIEHYRRGQELPAALERARALAVSPAYLAVEVYPDRLVCVRADGSVVLLEGES